MDRDDAGRPQDSCQKALTDVVRRELDKPPADRTFQPMAKAAVAVLEAVCDRR